MAPGQSVLVNGAGGAVGSLVVQLAVDAGANVTAVDAPRHADRLRGYGVDRVVGPLDLAEGPAAVGGPFHVVVNHVRVSPEELARLSDYVADAGVAVSTAGPIPEDPARSVRSASLWVRSDAGRPSWSRGWMPAGCGSTSPPVARWPSWPRCTRTPGPGGCRGRRL
ncbi:zinc-binding dehydrogenase [Embleya hyalina]|uniref:NADPH:quinone reductase n=1 Tax=Embleya hyalina TaxID=516124 RepID=A0A401YMR2_9ACTN|nr:zinc-binding dehydrogenase [Embleya hyalina]GCD95789.1 NADPH:quinone reductase [Embleya hyalina]